MIPLKISIHLIKLIKGLGSKYEFLGGRKSSPKTPATQLSTQKPNKITTFSILVIYR